ncbi:MAG: hypothetical protein AB7P14_02035 [Blastocatellales bacterium]
MWNLIRHHATKGRVIVLAVISLLSAMLLSHSYLLSRISSNNGKLGSRLGKNAEALSLHMGKVVEREMAEGQTHFFQITLDHNQYLALDFEQRGVRIEVSIYEPSGNLGSLGTRVVRPISWASESEQTIAFQIET